MIENVILLYCLVLYTLLVPVFYYLEHTKEMLQNALDLSRHPRKRNELSKLLNSAKTRKSFSLIWPVLVFKAIVNDFKSRK